MNLALVGILGVKSTHPLPRAVILEFALSMASSAARLTCTSKTFLHTARIRISMPVIELVNDVRGVQNLKGFQPGIAVLLPEQSKGLLEFNRPF